MTREMLKNMSKQQLRGNWITGVLAVLCVLLIGFAASAICDIIHSAYILFQRFTVFSALLLVSEILLKTAASIFSSGLALGLISFFIKIARGRTAKVEDIFSMLRYSFKAFGLTCVTCFFVFLWACLFIIPGIVAALRYSQAMFVMAENPEIKIMDALRQSKQLMTGRKAEFFILNLSFIGWSILASITVVGVLWLEVYMQTVFANYYFELGQSNTYRVY